MENKRFLTANDVAKYMGISVPMAYKIIRRLSDELVTAGYIIVSEVKFKRKNRSGKTKWVTKRGFTKAFSSKHKVPESPLFPRVSGHLLAIRYYSHSMAGFWLCRYVVVADIIAFKM